MQLLAAKELATWRCINQDKVVIVVPAATGRAIFGFQPDLREYAR
jgi:hypothetical protein